jgi:hypothetical protein
VADFIRISVAGAETLLNLAQVVSIQFWAGDDDHPATATIVTTGHAASRHAEDPATAHTLVVAGAGPIAGLRDALTRAGLMPPEAAPSFPPYDAREDEPYRAAPEAGEPTPDRAVIDASMPAAGPKFDRGRPRRGYNNPL